ncbi:MAG TPA: MotA/TolQ/ExbB proton channel family protein [Erythrobacter sp.]|nr:MotA/TolQ/ExbB proton channel family protein [Erythrobacter sp.]
MPNNLTSLIDPGAFAIVVVGTVLACAARSGWRDFGAALQQAGGLLRRRFDADANRKALALAVSSIQREGPHRADPALPPDRQLGMMLETFLRQGSLETLHAARRAQRALDEARRISAAQVFGWAGELAPVFGLIGTLYGLTQLAPGNADSPATAIMAAVSTAVLTSLYGALLAHLLCYPLAGAIERRGLEEERTREALSAWFVEQLASTAIAAQERRAHLRGVA